MSEWANPSAADEGGDDPGQPWSTVDVVGAVDAALGAPPVGVVVVAVRAGQGAAATPPEDLLDRELQLLVSDRDRVIVNGGGRRIVVRAALTAPAEAEGFAYRLHAAVSAQPIEVSIGVAVSARGDEAIDVVRRAEQAVADAGVLGGDGVVVGDDRDDELPWP